MILRAGRHIFFGQRREKPFDFLLAGQVGRQALDEVAISFEPRTVTALGGQRKVFATDDIAQLFQSLLGVPDAILIHGQQVVYQ